jgi:UDP-N-acetylglucosamine 2-epimerase
VKHNFNVLAGADTQKIVEAYSSHMFNEDYEIDLYGRGKASAKIVNELLALKQGHP